MPLEGLGENSSALAPAINHAVSYNASSDPFLCFLNAPSRVKSPYVRNAKIHRSIYSFNPLFVQHTVSEGDRTNSRLYGPR